MAAEFDLSTADDELLKKLAVLLCDKVWKNDSYFVQESFAWLKAYRAGEFSADMLRAVQNTTQDFTLTEEAARPRLDAALARGVKQLELYASHPMDTNARFFRVKYRQVNWDE